MITVKGPLSTQMYCTRLSVTIALFALERYRSVFISKRGLKLPQKVYQKKTMLNVVHYQQLFLVLNRVSIVTLKHCILCIPKLSGAEATRAVPLRKQGL